VSQAHADRLAGGLRYRNVAAKWGWFVALGVVLILAGLFALGDVVAFTLISVIFIGAMLLVGGIFQIIHAFMTKGWSDFFLNLLMGAIYVVGGFLIMDEPVQGSVLITLFLLAALLVGGIMRIVVAVRHREMAGWWLLVLSGLISVVLAVVLYMSLPWSGLWVLGTVIAIELLVQGFSWLQFGLSLRKLARQA
jgi:uncharacterized membrane protein HdeD (DUF308 family)